MFGENRSVNSSTPRPHAPFIARPAFVNRAFTIRPISRRPGPVPGVRRPMFWGSEAGFCNPSHTFGLQRGRAGLPGLSEHLLFTMLWGSEVGFCNPSHTFGFQRGHAGLPGLSKALLFTMFWGSEAGFCNPSHTFGPPRLDFATPPTHLASREVVQGWRGHRDHCYLQCFGAPRLDFANPPTHFEQTFWFGVQHLGTPRLPKPV